MREGFIGSQKTYGDKGVYWSKIGLGGKNNERKKTFRVTTN